MRSGSSNDDCTTSFGTAGAGTSSGRLMSSAPAGSRGLVGEAGAGVPDGDEGPAGEDAGAVDGAWSFAGSWPGGAGSDIGAAFGSTAGPGATAAADVAGPLPGEVAVVELDGAAAVELDAGDAVAPAELAVVVEPGTLADVVCGEVAGALPDGAVVALPVPDEVAPLALTGVIVDELGEVAVTVALGPALAG